jgi:hypothetical protein
MLKHNLGGFGLEVHHRPHHNLHLRLHHLRLLHLRHQVEDPRIQTRMAKEIQTARRIQTAKIRTAKKT